jgi:hypothetical protein
MAGTPIKPPTAMVPSSPVAKPRSKDQDGTGIDAAEMHHGARDVQAAHHAYQRAELF